MIHRERITCAIFLCKQEGKKMISNVDRLWIFQFLSSRIKRACLRFLNWIEKREFFGRNHRNSFSLPRRHLKSFHWSLIVEEECAYATTTTTTTTTVKRHDTGTNDSFAMGGMARYNRLTGRQTCDGHSVLLVY